MKTFLMTLSFSLAGILSCICIQLRGERSVDARASYLDPWLIDIIAFSAAVFLVIEGIVRQVQTRDVAVSKQITRAIRIAIGAGVMTIHIIQFMHK